MCLNSCISAKLFLKIYVEFKGGAAIKTIFELNLEKRGWVQKMNSDYCLAFYFKPTKE